MVAATCRGTCRRPRCPPTLADVAERAGVSRQTVSNAVNNPDLLRPDTLARVQEAIDELGYSPNRAARNLRTRASHLIGLRVHARAGGHRQRAMDRFVHSLVETSREAGYHVLLFPGDRRGPARGVRRPAALHRRRRVRRHRHLPRQPAGRLARDPAGAVRRLRPAVGRPRRRGTPGSTSTARPAPSSPPATCSSAGHQRIAWIGWRKDSWIGEDRRAGWSRALRARGLPTTGLASRVEDTVASGREASARPPRRGPADRRSSAPPTPWRWACCTPSPTAGLRAGRDIAVVGFDDSQVAQVVPPGLTSVRQPLEEVAVEIVKALEGLLGHPPTVGPGVLLG